MSTTISSLSAVDGRLKERPERSVNVVSLEFDYTIYIKITPARLWRLLTDPAHTRRYWGTALYTDWAPGSPIVWEERGARTSDPEQVVLEAEPGRLLSYTWHTFSSQWAAAVGVDEGTRAKLAAEPRSKAVFEIAPVGEVVSLTLTHYFGAAETLYGMCARAWPALLSSLKTLAETGDILPLRAN